MHYNLCFVYGLDGRLIIEFSGATGALIKEYIYGAGGLLATIEPTAVSSNGTRYTTADSLASPRVVTNSSATVVSRHDYMPFGEELGAGVGGRTTGMGFPGPSDGLREKFTQKERDNETGLDYFLARYYSSGLGRFSSADEFVGGPDELFDFSAVAAENPTFYADLTQPQSLNKYQYCLNNPLIYVDPDGHQQALTQRTLIENGYFSETFKGLGAAVDKLIDKGSNPLRTWDEIREEVQRALGTDSESQKRRTDESLGPPRDKIHAMMRKHLDMWDFNSLPISGMVVSRIHDDKRMVKLAEQAGASVQKGIDQLTSQLARGNLNPGIGTKNLFGNISYARASDGARVFFRIVGQRLEILAKASKENEQAVIDRLKKLYQK